MDTLRSVVKAVVWGLCVLVMIACILMVGTVGWIAMDARVSPNVATESVHTLTSVKPVVADIEKLRKYADSKYREEDWEDKQKAESAIRNAVELLEKQVEPYCDKAQCIGWYQERYRFYEDISTKREQWAKELPRMLERQSNQDEIRADNWLQLARVACALVALILLLYLFVAFTKFFRIGWKRLAALTVLVAPAIFIAFAFSLREVDALYGNWDLSGKAVDAAMLILLLYPFVVIPPLWVLNKKVGRSVLDALAYWREPKAT